MKTSVTYRQIWLIAYPIIIGSIAQNLINVTDTAFLGRVDEVALGAGAIGGVFYLAATMLTWGFGIGTQIIIARRNGEQAFSEIGRTFQHGLYFQLPLALALFSIIRFFSGDILGHIIRSVPVMEYTLEYTKYRSFGIFFASVNMLFRGFYIGIERTKVITWTTLFMAVINGFLDYSLIFGKFGMPEMGIGGAALASSISEGFAMVFFLYYTVFRLDSKPYRLFHHFRFDNILYKRIIRISLPVMLQNFLSMAAWLAFFLMIEKLGEQALAVSNIIRSLYVVLMIPIWGFSSATNTLVSNLIGRGKQEEVLSLVFKILKLSGLAVLLVAIFCSAFPNIALEVYTNNQELLRASLPVLYVVNVAAFCLSLSFILFSGVSGTGKTQVTFFIEISVVVLYLACTYVLADVLRLEVYQVWMAEILYGILIGTISLIYLRSGNWRSSLV